MKIIDFFFENRKARLYTIFGIICLLLIKNCFWDAILGYYLKQCSSTSSMLQLTSMSVTGYSVVGRAVLNLLKYMNLPNRFWLIFSQTVKWDNILLMILFVLFVLPYHQNQTHAVLRGAVVFFAVSEIIVYDIMIYCILRALNATSSAFVAFWLSTGGKAMLYGNVIIILMILCFGVIKMVAELTNRNQG